MQNKARDLISQDRNSPSKKRKLDDLGGTEEFSLQDAPTPKVRMAIDGKL